MPFIKPLPHWEAPGIEPPLSLRQNGWKAGVKPPDEYFNHLQNKAYEALKELQEYAVHKDDMNLSDLTTDEEFEMHLADESMHVYYGDDTGTANAKVLTIPEVTLYKKGMAVAFTNLKASTGDVTININGLGAVPVTKSNGSAANLKADIPYTIRHNGTSFILQGEGGEYGTATASDVIASKTIGTESGIVEGTIPNKSTGDHPSTVASAVTTRIYVKAPKGYYNDNNIYVDDPDFIAANILGNKNIFGLQGSIPNFGRAVLNGGYTGFKSIKSDSVGSLVVEPNTGYYEEGVNANGYGSIIINDPDFIPANIKSGVNILGVTGTMEGAIAGAKRSAKGTAICGNGGDNVLSVRGLSFTPSTVLARPIAASDEHYYGFTAYTKGVNLSHNLGKDSGVRLHINDGGDFILPVKNMFAGGFDIATMTPGANLGWIAYE